MSRNGLSLVELLVVLAILGVLVALTLAGVQRVRAASDRTRCQNNIRQVSLAAHDFASAQGHFPTGVSNKSGASPEPFMGWQTRLLPHLEQSARWAEAVEAFRKDKDFLHNPPHVGLTVAVPMFSCPSDPRARVPQPITGGVMRGLTSYLGVEGTNSFHLDGIYYLDSATKPADITDGLSNTLAIGERPPSADAVFGWWYAGWGQDKDGEGDMLLGVRTKNNQVWVKNCPVGPFPFAAGRLDNQCDAFHFWSPHSGGANFAFADGSVRFLTYSADAVLPALATRAGGETVSLPD